MHRDLGRRATRRGSVPDGCGRASPLIPFHLDGGTDEMGRSPAAPSHREEDDARARRRCWAVRRPSLSRLRPPYRCSVLRFDRLCPNFD
uniref:Uncharacterized protein n=1 Tax=Triticum urartu TaxID=4572 RepID=A0A8R7R1Y4_TRIUA